MWRWARWVVAGLLLFSVLATAGALPPEPTYGVEATEDLVHLASDDDPLRQPRLERFTLEPRDPPLSAGDIVPVHAVVHPGPLEGPAQLHVIVDKVGSDPGPGVELEPDPRTVGPHVPELLMTFWEPAEPGRYLVQGHVHVADETIPLPERAASVAPASAGQPPVDDSTLQVGVAPGTVLWALVFIGLAFATRLRKRDRGS